MESEALALKQLAHERLFESDDRFRLLVESIQDYAIFMLDPEGYVRTWNLGAERMKGYAPHEIIGRNFSTFYRAEDVVSGKCERELQVARDQGRVEDDGWRVRKDGSEFWASVMISALRDDSGELVGFAMVTRDLTERKRSEEALRFSEERFRLLVENVKDYAIFMLDPQGIVSTWNQGAERLKGYKSQEIIGQHFSKFYSAEEVASGKCEYELVVAAEVGRFEDEGYRIRKDGTQFWANVVITALRDKMGTLIGFAKVTRDLTERKRAEDERVQLAKAQEANRIKDEFLATISHELRTPLNAILGWSSLLSARTLDPEAAKALATIRRNAQAQARIIEDILDVSRIVTGKLRLEVKAIDLASIVRDAIAVVEPTALAKQIEIVVERLVAPALLMGDATRLQQVIWNLLSNAVKFTDTDGKIHVALDDVGGRLELTVRDTGRGIEPAFLPFVFERFRQADSSTTRKFGGLGLGLAIVRHITELHGGEVSAESPGRGQGATFRVSLPVRVIVPSKESLPAPHATHTPAAPPPHLDLSGISVLIVEDEQDSRELLEALLTSFSANVHSVGSAQDARALISTVRPDVLISDIAMPDEDGYSLIRYVRGLPRAMGGATPAIALTAYARAEDRVRIFDAGFNNFLSKPVESGELVTVVRNLAQVAKSSNA